jgi:cation diffusion facilitator CzcD-associated flavoprotein CzcO
MTVSSAESESVGAAENASIWVRDFASALESGDSTALARLLRIDSWWRDLLALSWTLRNFVGRGQIVEGLLASVAANAPRDFALSPTSVPVTAVDGNDVHIAAFFDFDTVVGHCRGFAELVSAGGTGDWQAQSIATQLESVHGFPEHTDANRPPGSHRGVMEGRRSWGESRAAEKEFLDSDPVVLVIGAGQNGISVAARLGQLDIPTLIVERNERVGDNWRRRYPSLALHSPPGADHLPYLSLPPTWPDAIPGAKFGNWMEFYCEAMELNVWTSTQVLATDDEESRGEWVVRVRRADGSERTLRPRHLIIATGLNGDPRIPDLPGAEHYKGEAMHSGMFPGAAKWRGNRTVVVGAGTSGHDIAQALYEAGADVTLVQRSPTYVITYKTHVELFLPTYLDGGPRTEDADLWGASVPPALIPTLHAEPVKQGLERDKDLLEGLRRQGYGVGEEGLFARHLSGVEGYYIDVGAGELIASGRIAVKHGSGVARFEADGIVLEDETYLPADLVVFATGYRGVLESAGALLGPAAADIPKVYGLDPDGEFANVWRYSGHDNLWFLAGSLPQARYYSKFVALQIKALEQSIVTNDELRLATADALASGGTSRTHVEDGRLGNGVVRRHSKLSEKY